uniref:Uncharacterized protein n=1 Tax=Strigamia maritima TaxID=126957 RepID=T1IJD0_STRMM
MAHIRIWDVFNLTTLTIIGVNDVDNGVGALAFSRQNEGSYLMVMDDSIDHVLSMWDWKHERVLGRTTTYTREVNGGKFHPHDDNVIITYGRAHLTAWRRRKDGMFQKNELMKTIGDNILCLEFDEDGDVIAGDSSGAISVWTDSGDGSFRLYKEFQAHQRGINSLLVLADGTLLSGGNDRYIKAWRNVKQYKLMATTMLPDTTGGVRTLCPQRITAEDSSVFVGTTRNIIVEGSLYRRFAITVQGHYKSLLALATDPDFASFATGGEDKAVCKWTMHRLQWRAQIETDCTALAFHPSDLVVVAGTQDGHIIALNADTGMHITTINVSKSPVSCMSYNKEGTQLAVGSKDGNIYLYSVTSSGFVYKRRNVMRGNDMLRNVDFSHDGRYLQSDTDDYDLLYWYIANFEQEKLPSTMRDVRWSRLTCTLGYSINGIWNNINQRLPGLITSSHVSSSNKLLSAADDEGYVRLFRYPCISPKADYHEIKPYTGRVTSVRFLYDDSFLITAGGIDAALMQWMVVSNR